jgi:hypothetical protein
VFGSGHGFRYLHVPHVACQRTNDCTRCLQSFGSLSFLRWVSRIDNLVSVNPIDCDITSQCE